MKLCETCTKRNCNHSIVKIKQDDLIIIKCLDYEKDIDKVRGYKKPLEKTVKVNKSIMGLYNPSWN